MTATKKPVRHPPHHPAIPIPEIPSADPSPAETLEEAESELGINDWIDPETGELAEGQSPPHLEE